MKHLIFGLIALAICGLLLFFAFNFLVPYVYQTNLLAASGDNPDEPFKQDLDSWLRLGIIFGISGAATGAFGIVLLIRGARGQRLANLK